MTTPKAPAKATAPKADAPKRERKAMLLDYSALSADDTQITQVRSSNLPANIVGWVRESWDKRAEQTRVRAGKSVAVQVGQAKAVTVPSKDAAEQLSNLLRRAAISVGCGIRIATEANGDSVTVKFVAQTKKASKPKTPAA